MKRVIPGVDEPCEQHKSTDLMIAAQDGKPLPAYRTTGDVPPERVVDDLPKEIPDRWKGLIGEYG